MSEDLKQTFITAVRQTPAGIADFLATPIAEPPAVTTPTTVDAAIIVNGVCAKYVLDMFRPFAGLTPVELLLRIGQHNSVLESAMIAGLEYLTDTQAAPDFEIVEPTAGTVYTLGDLRVTARAKNATAITRLAGALGEKTFVLKETDGLWRQFVIVTDAGEYTLTLTATCGTGDPVEHSVTFRVTSNPEEEPDPTEPPDGKDADALQRAYTNVADGYTALMNRVAQWGAGTDVKDAVTTAYQSWKTQISQYLTVAAAYSPSATVVQDTKAALYDIYYPAAAEAIFTENIDDVENVRILAIKVPLDYLHKVITAL